MVFQRLQAIGFLASKVHPQGLGSWQCTRRIVCECDERHAISDERQHEMWHTPDACLQSTSFSDIIGSRFPLKVHSCPPHYGLKAMAIEGPMLPLSVCINAWQFSTTWRDVNLNSGSIRDSCLATAFTTSLALRLPLAMYGTPPLPIVGPRRLPIDSFPLLCLRPF